MNGQRFTYSILSYASSIQPIAVLRPALGSKLGHSFRLQIDSLSLNTLEIPTETILIQQKFEHLSTIGAINRTKKPILPNELKSLMITVAQGRIELPTSGL